MNNNAVAEMSNENKTAIELLGKEATGATFFRFNKDKMLTKSDAKVLVKWHKEQNSYREVKARGIAQNDKELSDFEGLALATLLGFVNGNINDTFVQTVFSYAFLCIDHSDSVSKQWFQKNYSEAMKAVSEQRASNGKTNKNAYTKFSKAVMSMYGVMLRACIVVDKNAYEQRREQEEKGLGARTVLFSKKEGN